MSTKESERQFYVEIREYDDDSENDILVRRFGPMDEARAAKVERGADMRLNLDRFYSRRVPAPPAAAAKE